MRWSLALSVLLFPTNTTPVVSPGPSATGWVCTTTQTAGFHYDIARKEWLPKTFSDRPQYTIVRPSAKDTAFMAVKSVWVVKQIGSDSPRYFCTKDFESGWLNCTSIFGEFQFSREALKFTISNTIAYFWELPLKMGDKTITQPDDIWQSLGVCNSF